MQFSPPFSQGTLIKRYKRFLADIETKDGEAITIHCPNTGSMKNCLQPGAPIWYSDSNNPKRKYRHTWEIATTPDGDLAGINTGRANALVEEALNAGRVPGLQSFSSLKREVRYGQQNSRADFWLNQGDQGVYVEVKNVTLLENGQGYFPDAVSDRALKHLAELMHVVEQGARAVLIYCIQHSGIDSVKAAAHIDPKYAEGIRRAKQGGVQIVALKAELSPDRIELVDTVPVLVD